MLYEPFLFHPIAISHVLRCAFKFLLMQVSLKVGVGLTRSSTSSPEQKNFQIFLWNLRSNAQ